MGASVGAATAVATSHHSEATSAAAEPQQGTFGGYTVSIPTAEVQQSLQRLPDSRHHPHPGDHACGPVETTGPGGAVTLKSRLVSGTQLGADFTNEYPSEDSHGRSLSARFTHVPELTHTRLINTSGQMLFSGLRHSFICAPELDRDLLTELTVDELKALICNLPDVEDPYQDGGLTRPQQIDNHCRTILSSKEGFDAEALFLRYRACRIMAGEVAAAALVADPDKFQQALAGNKVDVNLFCISLLAPAHITAWSYQPGALWGLQSAVPLKLRLRGPDDVPHSVLVDVNVRQFLLPAETESLDKSPLYHHPYLKLHLRAAVRELLGPLDCTELGGDVKARVDALKHDVPELRNLCEALAQAHSQSSEASAADRSDWWRINRGLAKSGDALASLERDARPLEEAALQLKRIWLEKGDWPAGLEVSRQVAARLALLGFLMRETPVLSCPNGKDYITQLDPEVKSLATVAHNQDGHLPPIESDVNVREPAHNAFAPLPWFTPEENTRRQELHRRVAESWHRTDLPKHLREDLFACVRLVHEVEQDTLRADALLNQAQEKPLSDDQRRELACLARRCDHILPAYRLRLLCTLVRLLESGALSAVDAKLLQQSLQRLADAHHYPPPGGQASRLIATTLPNGPGGAVAVASRLVPGTQLGASFAHGYPSDDGRGGPPSTRFIHVPELAQTSLVNARGQTLFSGLRHGLINADELGAGLVRALADDELKAVIGNLLIVKDRPRADGLTRAEQIDDQFQRFRAEGEWTEPGVALLQKRAGRIMASEAAAAAVVADSNKFQRALAGETVKVNLFSISLVTPADAEAWSFQYDALGALQKALPLELGLRGPDGSSHSVLVDVSVRQFMLPGGAESLDKAEPYWHPHLTDGRLKEVEKLLGPLGSPELGGDVKARVDAMHASVRDLRDLFNALDRAHSLNQEASVAAHSDWWEKNYTLGNARDDLASLENGVRTLEEAGAQLKSMWRERRDWPAGAEAARQAAARLALLGFLMHETPLLSCPNGKDYTRQLDPEVQLLATVADNQHGRLPPVDPDSKPWEAARNAFAPR